jgi:hypothetical protein
MVKNWHGRTLVFQRNGLTFVPDYDTDLEYQIARRDRMAAAHPEIDWLGRIGGVHSAYVHLERGGYQAGGDTLAELLDKLDEFFDPTDCDEPDTG